MKMKMKMKMKMERKRKKHIYDYKCWLWHRIHIGSGFRLTSPHREHTITARCCRLTAAATGPGGLAPTCGLPTIPDALVKECLPSSLNVDCGGEIGDEL